MRAADDVFGVFTRLHGEEQFPGSGIGLATCAKIVAYHGGQISIDDVVHAYRRGALKEVWGTGTAAVISPVGELAYKGTPMVINDGKIGSLTQRLYDAIVGIQYGQAPDPDGWTVEV